MRKQIFLYNNLVTVYNRSRKKLARLVASGKNERKQTILRRRIQKLFLRLQSLSASFRLGLGSVALAGAASFFSANEAKAQFFAPEVTNPFGLNYSFLNRPAVADLDNDGDVDMIIGDTLGNIRYYKNSGSAAVPSFDPVVVNPFSIVPSPSFFHAFGDLDNDGDLDILSGQLYGDFSYYENTGTATAPAFAAPVTNPFSLVNMGGYFPAPALADLDNDGDLDLLCGSYYGEFFYFPNTGSASAPSFDPPIPDAFSMVIAAYLSSPAFGDLDGDGDLDIMGGGYSGSTFNWYQNTGTTSSPVFAAPVSDTFNLSNTPGQLSWPALADFDNDGDLDMISGSYYGAFYYYENDPSLIGIQNAVSLTGISAYPNPTGNAVTVNCGNNIAEKILLRDAAGRELLNVKPQTNQQPIDLSLYEPGIYFVEITLNHQTGILKLVKK